MTMDNPRIARLNVKDLSRLQISPNAVLIPIMDASGLNVELTLSPEIAHRLVVDLKMTLLCSTLVTGTERLSMPKAPAVLDVHSWSTGLNVEKQYFVLRLEGERGEMMDAKLSIQGALELARHIRDHAVQQEFHHN